MEDISIKKLGSKDAQFLSDVAIKAYSDHYLDLWYDGGKWYLKKFFSPHRLATEINDQNARFYVAFYKNISVGFLKININAPLQEYEGKNALELERIYLNKEAAGKGIGRKLIQLTLAIAIENNKDLVWLKAMDTSKGTIAFYKEMGFEITGTHKLKHPLMKEELRGMVVMTKILQG